MKQIFLGVMVSLLMFKSLAADVQNLTITGALNSPGFSSIFASNIRTITIGKTTTDVINIGFTGSTGNINLYGGGLDLSGLDLAAGTGSDSFLGINSSGLLVTLTGAGCPIVCDAVTANTNFTAGSSGTPAAVNLVGTVNINTSGTGLVTTIGSITNGNLNLTGGGSDSGIFLLTATGTDIVCQSGRGIAMQTTGSGSGVGFNFETTGVIQLTGSSVDIVGDLDCSGDSITLAASNETPPNNIIGTAVGSTITIGTNSINDTTGQLSLCGNVSLTSNRPVSASTPIEISLISAYTFPSTTIAPALKITGADFTPTGAGISYLAMKNDNTLYVLNTSTEDFQFGGSGEVDLQGSPLKLNTTNGGQTIIGNITTGAAVTIDSHNNDISLTSAGTGDVQLQTTGTGDIALLSGNSIIFGDSAVITYPGSGTSALYINSNGAITTSVSSARFKEGIKNLHITKEDFMNIIPKVFTYIKNKTKGWGVIAEDLLGTPFEAAIIYDKDGNVHSVDYQMLFTASMHVVGQLCNDFALIEERIKNIENQK